MKKVSSFLFFATFLLPSLEAMDEKTFGTSYLRKLGRPIPQFLSTNAVNQTQDIRKSKSSTNTDDIESIDEKDSGELPVQQLQNTHRRQISKTTAFFSTNNLAEKTNESKIEIEEEEIEEASVSDTELQTNENIQGKQQNQKQSERFEFSGDSEDESMLDLLQNLNQTGTTQKKQKPKSDEDSASLSDSNEHQQAIINESFQGRNLGELADYLMNTESDSGTAQSRSAKRTVVNNPPYSVTVKNPDMTISVQNGRLLINSYGSVFNSQNYYIGGKSLNGIFLQHPLDLKGSMTKKELTAAIRASFPNSTIE